MVPAWGPLSRKGTRMYDDFDPRFALDHDEWSTPTDRGDGDRRLRHLVFLDGRLVDGWVEPVGGTPYAWMARELDAERRRPAPPPPRPAHERVLPWLDAVAGGRKALESLTDEPLTDPPPVALDSEAAQVTYDAAADLVARVAGELFRDDEVRAAARHLLHRVWDTEPELLGGRRTVAQVVGGLFWVVGRANALFGQSPTVRMKDVQRALWLKQPLGDTGPLVEQCVRRLVLEPVERPAQFPRLHAVGDPLLLTSATRREVIRWRDHAFEAREAHLADRSEIRVLPSEVES